MAHRARDNRISRRSWLLAGMALPLFRARAAEVLSVAYDGDTLRPMAPTLHFLTGKPLDRLKDASTVAFVSQLTIFGEDHVSVIKQAHERMIISYDIWEERFSVKMSMANLRTTSPLATTAATENWCLENLAISTAGLPRDRFFYLRWELRSVDQREIANVMTEPGLSFRALIELFSRKPGADGPHWQLDTSRLRLADLVRMPGRGRIG
jgi:hypothetical protein